MTMSLSRAIGGYFELELPLRDSFPYGDAELLSTGRSCFEYILSARKPVHVYLPKFTCDVMLEPLHKLDIAYTLYSINEKLELAEELSPEDGEMILYTNYFGVKDAYCARMSARYADKLILDCSQAFFFEPVKNSHTFYSPRKFFGLPDGGCLYTDKRIAESLEQDVSFGRSAHLLMRIDIGAEDGYEQFVSNDKSLERQPLKRMSNLTKRILDSIDYGEALQRRNSNYGFLSAALEKVNSARFVGDMFKVPMYYPLLLDNKGAELRKFLIKNRIYAPTYWPNIYEWCKPEEQEHYMTTNIVPLPIDQRYDENDMITIVKTVNEFLQKAE